MSQDEKALEVARYPIWFGLKGFVGNTDEKELTNQTIDVLFQNLRKHAPSYLLQHPDSAFQFLDIGSGRGGLTSNIADLLHQYRDSAQVSAGDALVEHAQLTHEAIDQALTKYQYIRGLPNIKHADLASENIDITSTLGMKNKADMALISHVGYYPFDEKGKQGLESLTNNAINALSGNGAAIFVHVSPASHLEPLKDKYGRLAEYKTTLAMREIFQSKNYKTNTLTFPARVTFPELSDAEWDKIINTNPNAKGNESYDNLTDKEYTVRALAEFTVHRRLEDLAKEGNLADYITDLRKLLKEHNNKPIIFNEVTVVLNPNAINNLATQKSIEKAVAETKLAIGDTITPAKSGYSASI